jgi:hypothetical protein
MPPVPARRCLCRPRGYGRPRSARTPSGP